MGCFFIYIKREVRTPDPLWSGRTNKNNLKMLFLFIRAKFAYEQASVSNA
jgi:hypothetical protein